MTLHKQIRERRIALGLTQEQAAKRAGWPDRCRWNEFEAGRFPDAKLSTLRRVAGAVECKIIVSKTGERLLVKKAI